MSRHPRPDEEYGGWDDIQDKNIEPGDTPEVRSDRRKALSAKFEAEERNKRLREKSEEQKLNELQLIVEGEFHEEGNFIAYVVLEDEIRPAVVKPSEDGVYVYEEWLSDKAGDMIRTEDFLEGSKAKEPELEALRTGILEGMNIGFSQDVSVGMPEGLRNYVEGVLDRVDQVDQYDFTEASGTYIMPKLSAEQYDQL